MVFNRNGNNYLSSWESASINLFYSLFLTKRFPFLCFSLKLSVSLLQRSPGPVSQSPGAPSPVKGANSNGELEKTPQKSPVKSTVNQEDKDRALEALQGEFETYRKEKAVNER